jgi:hypothetical protein
MAPFSTACPVPFAERRVPFGAILLTKERGAVGVYTYGVYTYDAPL